MVVIAQRSLIPKLLDSNTSWRAQHGHPQSWRLFAWIATPSARNDDEQIDSNTSWRAQLGHPQSWWLFAWIATPSARNDDEQTILIKGFWYYRVYVSVLFCCDVSYVYSKLP